MEATGKRIFMRGTRDNEDIVAPLDVTKLTGNSLFFLCLRLRRERSPSLLPSQEFQRR